MFVVGCYERVQGARVAAQVAHELTAVRGVEQSGPPWKAQKGGKQQQPQKQQRKPEAPGVAAGIAAGVTAGVAAGVAAEGGAAAGVSQGAAAAPLRVAGCLLLSYPLHPPDKTVRQGQGNRCAGKVGAVRTVYTLYIQRINTLYIQLTYTLCIQRINTLYIQLICTLYLQLIYTLCKQRINTLYIQLIYTLYKGRQCGWVGDRRQRRKFERTGACQGSASRHVAVVRA